MTFTELESSADNRLLKEQLLQRLQDEGLPTAAATQSHFKTLLNTWQIPMYNFNFHRIKVSQTELKDIQDRILAAEIGHGF